MAKLSTDQLNAGAAHVALSPSEQGTVELVLRRPATDQREIMDSISVVPGEGIVGDNYLERGDSKRPDGSAHPEAQICVMNSRVLDLVADGDKDKWQLAGDQIIVDFDLTQENAPAGTRLGVGSAVLEVSNKPHNGCAKFSQRFGLDAAKWTNGNDRMRYRGINVMVVSAGEISAGDSVVKLAETGTGSYPPA